MNLTIDLPADIADFLQEEVRSGHFEDETAAVIQVLRAAQLESGIREALGDEEVLQSLEDAYKDAVHDPSSGVAIDDVRARLHRIHAEAMKSVA